MQKVWEMGQDRAHAGGAWVAQSVKRPTWAQVMISRSVSSSPASGSVLTARNLLRILCLPLSLCPSPAHTLSLCLSVCLSLKNKEAFKKIVLIGESSPTLPLPPPQKKSQSHLFGSPGAQSSRGKILFCARLLMKIHASAVP